jgi:predicted PurR-regulated permease PerM
VATVESLRFFFCDESPLEIEVIGEMPPGMFREHRSGEETLQLALRLGLLAALVFWCLVLVRPFVPIIAWAIVLSVALYRPYDWLSRHFGRPKLAAFVVTVLAMAIVIGPATWLGLGLAQALTGLSEQVVTGRLTVPSPPTLIRDWPFVGERVYDFWALASTNLEATFTQVSPYLTPLVRPMLGVIGSFGVGALKFLVSIVLTGFLLPAGAMLAAASRTIMARLLPDSREDFVALAGATIRAVSLGVIGVALLQSFLFGIGLKFAGIDSASMLAVIVMILSILQLGAGIVLIPCVIWIWMTKDMAVAMPVTLYLIFVGLIDNVLKPLLMGRGLTTPLPVIFVGLLGGTLAHGIVGLFIGPIVLAVGWDLMTAWMRAQKSAAERAPAEIERFVGERRD